MTKWFGQSWGAPACVPEDHIPVPAWEVCCRCGEPIMPDSQGVSIPLVSVSQPPPLLHHHLDCYLKKVLPHQADCPHCRGRALNDHPKSCAMHQGGYCNCDLSPFTHL